MWIGLNRNFIGHFWNELRVEEFEGMSVNWPLIGGLVGRGVSVFAGIGVGVFVLAGIGVGVFAFACSEVGVSAFVCNDVGVLACTGSGLGVFSVDTQWDMKI